MHAFALTRRQFDVVDVLGRHRVDLHGAANRIGRHQRHQPKIGARQFDGLAAQRHHDDLAIERDQREGQSVAQLEFAGVAHHFAAALVDANGLRRFPPLEWGLQLLHVADDRVMVDIIARHIALQPFSRPLAKQHMVLLLASWRARLRNRPGHQRRQSELRGYAKQFLADRRRRIGVLQLIDEFQRAIEMAHRNIYPMLPSRVEINGPVLDPHFALDPGLQTCSPLSAAACGYPPADRHTCLQAR
ncbi:hypothetical protein BQ8794_200288 [Mesorhizobium prunaredense]|uniref:Uncharacterized protein n=1 Tax=Mesorhizobium prunaredense TaxID=1631249 RepID=A0A1R3V5U2_9HYPH|nr:hypothetical protein BQ8794_200288 [Mesorhizobium prunaredense]